MAETTYNSPFTRQRWRVDTINGQRFPPVKDPTAPLPGGLNWKKVNRIDTANFAMLKRTGSRLPENEYYLYRENYSMPTAPHGLPHLTIYWIPTGDKSEYYGPLDRGWSTFTYLTISASDWNILDAKLQAKLLSKIKNMKVNLGNFVGERNQMFRMFGDTAKKIARAINHVRRGRFKKAFEALGCLPSKRLSTRKSVANNWLELQYGWLPLLSDLFEMSLLVEAAFDDIVEKPPLNVATGVVTWANRDKQQLAAPPCAVVDRQSSVHHRGKITYKVDSQAAAFLGSVGLTNPLSVAWELLPFSFLADWVLPIGKMLENLDATIGCTYVSGVGSSFIRYIGNYSCPFCSYVFNTNYRYVYQNLGGRTRYFRYDRWSMGGFPSVGLPQWKDPFSAAHAANGLALLSQNFR